MANQYVINAGLRLGVTSATVTPVVSSLKKQFAANPINVPVNIKVSTAASRNIKTISSSLQSLDTILINISKSAHLFEVQLNTLGGSLANLRKGLAGVNSSAQTFNRLSASANKATRSVTTTGRAIQNSTRSALTFGEAIGVATRRLGAFAPSALLIYGLGGRFVEAAQAALEFDSELVKLKQVGGDSERVIASIASSVTKLGKELGVNSGNLIKSAVTLRQAGLSATETRKALDALGKTTLSASFDDLSSTTEGVIAILSQFKGGVGKLETQLGSISKVSADYAVESKDLVEAIKRMGGAFSTTGGDLNELLAVFTTVRATTRESAESIATGIRTITAQMQSPEAEAALRGLGINIRDDNKQALSLYKSLDLISQKIKDLPTTDKRFAILETALGGRRNFSRIIPLLKETDLRHNVYNTAKQGEGILDKDAVIAQQKLTVQIDKMKESFLELFRIVSNDSSIRLFFAGITKLVTSLAFALKEIRPLIPIFTTLATIGILRGTRSFAGNFHKGFTQVKGLSNGGTVGGIPSDIRSGTDSIPALLSPNEFVLSTTDVRNMGGTANVDRMRKMARGVDQFSRLSGKYGYDAAYDVTKKQQNFHDERNNLLKSHFVTAGTLEGYKKHTSRIHKMVMKERLYRGLLEAHGVDANYVKPHNYGRKLKQIKRAQLYEALNTPRGGTLSGSATGISPITGYHSFDGTSTATHVRPTRGILASLSRMFLKRAEGGPIINKLQSYLDKQGVKLNVKDYIGDAVIDKNIPKGKAGKFDPQTGNIHIAASHSENLQALLHELGHAIDFKHGNGNYASSQGIAGFSDVSKNYVKEFIDKKKSSIGLAGLHKYKTEAHPREGFANAFASHVTGDRPSPAITSLLNSSAQTTPISQRGKRNTLPDRRFVGYENRSKIGSFRSPEEIPNPNRHTFTVSSAGTVTAPSAGISPSKVSSDIPLSQYVRPKIPTRSNIGIEHGSNAIGNVIPLVNDTDPYGLAPRGEARAKRLSAQTPKNVGVTHHQYIGQGYDFAQTAQLTLVSKAQEGAKKAFPTFNNFFKSLGKGVADLDKTITKTTGGTAIGLGRLKGIPGKIKGFASTGVGKATIGIAAGIAAPLITDHLLGNAEKPGYFGSTGAKAGSVLAGAAGGATTGALVGSQFGAAGTAVGAFAGALFGAYGSLKAFDEELKQIDLKTLGETLSSIDLSKGKLSNIDSGKIQGLVSNSIQSTPPERNNLLGKIIDQFNTSESGVVKSKKPSKAELLDTIDPDKRKEFSSFALNHTQAALKKNPNKSIQDITKEFGVIEKEGHKIGLGDLVTNEDKQKFHDLFKSFGDLQAKLDALDKNAANSFNLTINELDIFNKALTQSGERLHNRQQASETGSNALQGQISSGVNNVTVGSLGGVGKHIQEFAKEGGQYDQARAELTKIIEQVGQDTRLDKGPDAAIKAQSLFKGGGAYNQAIKDQLGKVLGDEKDLLKKTDTFAGARAIADKVLEQSPANAVKQSYDQNNPALRQAVDIRQSARVNQQNRRIEIDQQKGSIAQIEAEKASTATQTNAILNPGSRREYTKTGESYSKGGPRRIASGKTEIAPGFNGVREIQFSGNEKVRQTRKNAFGLYSSRTVSAEEASQRDLNKINEGAFSTSQEAINGIKGGGTAEQIAAQIATQKNQLAVAQSDKEKFKGTDIHKFNEANDKVTELTAGLKRSTMSLNALSLSTIKVDGAQKELAIATAKFQGDLQSRTNDADVALFGSKKEQKDLYQTEQLTQQVQQNPELLSQLSDKQRSAVGSRLKESGDQVRSFEQYDTYGRFRGTKDISGNDTLQTLRQQYLQPTRGSTNLNNQVGFQKNKVDIAQDERKKNNQINIGVQSTDVEEQAKSTTENFAKYVNEINESIARQMVAQSEFAKSTKELIGALTGFPSEITIKRDGRLEVIFNGLGAVTMLKGEFGQMVKEALANLPERVQALEEQKAR